MTSNIGAHLSLVDKTATPSSRHGLGRSAGKHHTALSIAFQSANKGHFNLSFASETPNSRFPRPRQLRATLSRNVLGGFVLYNEATRAVGPRKAVDGGGDCETSRVTAGSTRQWKGATPPFEVSRSAVRPRPGSAPRPAEVPPAQTPAIPTTFFRGARRRRRGSGSPTKPPRWSCGRIPPPFCGNKKCRNLTEQFSPWRISTTVPFRLLPLG